MNSNDYYIAHRIRVAEREALPVSYTVTREPDGDVETGTTGTYRYVVRNQYGTWLDQWGSRSLANKQAALLTGTYTVESARAYVERFDTRA